MKNNIKEFLKQEFIDNLKKISELERKAKILENNTISKKFEYINTLFGLSYPLCFVTFLAMSVPHQLSIFLSFGISALLSISGQHLIFKMLRYDKGLKKVSKSKNNKEIIEEKVKCDLEKEKLNERNKTVKIAFDKVDFYENLKLNYAQEEIDKIISNNNETYLNELNKLDTLVTKKFLSEEFKNEKNSPIIIDSLYGGLLNTLIFIIIVMLFPTLFNSFKSLNISYLNFFEVMIPLIVGFGCGTAYNVKKRVDVLNALNTINNELGENKLLNNSKDNDMYIIIEKLNNQINKTVYSKLISENYNKTTKVNYNNYMNQLNNNYNIEESIRLLEEVKEEYMNGLNVDKENGFVKTKTFKNS